MRKIFTILVLIACACDEDNKGACGELSSPLIQLETLSNIVVNGTIVGRSECSIYAGAQLFSCRYNNEPAYYLTNAASSLSTCGQIAYNCRGEEILNGATDSWSDFLNNTTHVRLLWQKNS